MPFRRIFTDFQRTLMWDLVFSRKIQVKVVCLALNRFRTLIPFSYLLPMLFN